MMLERGMNVEHIKIMTQQKAPWEFEHAGKLTQEQGPILYKLEIIRIKLMRNGG
jgi:hypothetical protein